jgi:hypothetical protein
LFFDELQIVLSIFFESISLRSFYAQIEVGATNQFSGAAWILLPDSRQPQRTIIDTMR